MYMLLGLVIDDGVSLIVTLRKITVKIIKAIRIIK